MVPYNPQIHHRRSIRLKEYDYSEAGLYFITLCCQDRVCMFGDVVNGEMKLNDAGKITNECWMEIPKHFPNLVLHEHIVMPNHIHGIIQFTVGAKNISPPQISQQSPIEAKNISPENDTNTRTFDIANQRFANVNDEIITNANQSIANTKNQMFDIANERFDVAKMSYIGNIGAKNISPPQISQQSPIGAKNVSPLRSPSKTIGSVVRGFKIGVTKWMRQNTDIYHVWQRNYYEHIIRNEQSYERIVEYIINNPAKWQEDKLFIK